MRKSIPLAFKFAPFSQVLGFPIPHFRFPTANFTLSATDFAFLRPNLHRTDSFPHPCRYTSPQPHGFCSFALSISRSWPSQFCVHGLVKVALSMLWARIHTYNMPRRRQCLTATA